MEATDEAKKVPVATPFSTTLIVVNSGPAVLVTWIVSLKLVPSTYRVEPHSDALMSCRFSSCSKAGWWDGVVVLRVFMIRSPWTSLDVGIVLFGLLRSRV